MVAASAASYSSSYRSWRYLNTCSSCDSMDGSRSMQTINNRHHCHRSSHQQYYHTRKPALKRQKRCTFATTATVAESTGLGGSSSDITGTQQTTFWYTNSLGYIRTPRSYAQTDSVETWQPMSCQTNFMVRSTSLKYYRYLYRIFGSFFFLWVNEWISIEIIWNRN